MSGVCAEQNNKFNTSHQLYHHPTKKASPFHHIDIPPRKLIFGRRDNINSDMFSDSPKFFSPNEALLRKCLPYNDGCDGGDEDGSEGENDPYSSDHFRMFEFKVRRCTRSRSHDWTDCPFAHPGEKARRRDPRRFHYSGAVCPEFRQGGCSRGDNCEFAHGVFECWLHPARYRTEACKDGKNCKRKVCFFAHTPQQLRILPPNSGGGCAAAEISPVSSDKKFRNLLSNSPNSNHCCVYCHSVTSSPTSTLMGIPHFSPPASPSPPLSPVSRRCSGSKFTPFCRYGGGGDRLMASENCDLKKYNSNAGLMSYKDVVTELMSSLEAMNINEGSHAGSSNGNGNQLWVDVCEDQQQQQQQQFILSPSNPNYPSGSSRDFYKNKNSSSNIDDKQINDNNGWSCPDLGWVNDLLM